MYIQGFDPLGLEYGTIGQETAEKMAGVLKAHSLSVTYNKSDKKFTIYNTSEMTIATIKNIFFEVAYSGWYPEVIEETDSLGNRLVQLIAIPTPVKVDGKIRLTLEDMLNS